jgi:hypothetical protein
MVSELKDLIQIGIQSIDEQNAVKLGEVMSRYAAVLEREGCEVKATAEDRRILMGHPGVLGVKGTGALQADALVVLVERDVDRQSLIELIQKRGLRLVSNGLTFESGVKCET